MQEELWDRYALFHIIDRVCLENGTEHRLTRPNHSWIFGQIERMNHTLKEAIIKCRQNEPARFIVNPSQQKVGLNTQIFSYRPLVI